MSQPQGERRLRIAVVALARNTFDVPLAETVAGQAFATLDAFDADIVGPRSLLFDADAARAAIDDLQGTEPDLVLVLQVTFTDATMTVALAQQVRAPLALWAFPEPRSGGRLRLNSLCGINLAAHALGKAGKPCAYLYAAGDDPKAPDRLREILAGGASASPAANGAGAPQPPPVDDAADHKAAAALGHLSGQRIGLFGTHPDGFDTCAFDPGVLHQLTGLMVDRFALDSVFASAAAVDPSRVAEIRREVEANLGDLSDMEAEPLDKSLRVYAALSDIARERQLDGLAVRCWPEFFTEYGCAACGPMAMLNGDGRPCACEADVYGDATNLLLAALTGGPVLMSDLVDLSEADDTGVLWHCGLAPLAMADREAEPPAATVHSNRRKPLLHEFALRPGRITITRLSQSLGQTRMVIGGAEMLRAPKSFSGTSGVVRFDRPVTQVLDRIMGEGLEHHYSFAYGDHRPALAAVARRLDLPTVVLA